MKYLLLMLTVASACKYEYECNGCTTCVNNICLSFDEGENCIPDNHVDIRRNLELYYEFFYLRHVAIEEFRCLPFGVSVRFILGMPMESNITKDYFYDNYNELLKRDCDGWGYLRGVP